MNCLKQFKKRKVDYECRVFNKEWTKKYFFTDVGVKAVCLICHETVAVFKEYNLKRHFQTKHANFGLNLSKQELHKKATDMVKKFKQQQIILGETIHLQKNAIKASFVLANEIAKQNKSFAEAEFIKDCIVGAVSVVCPEVKSKVEAISLSATTIAPRIDEIAVNIQEQLLTTSGSFHWFSIALDESNYIQDTTQLLIYIRGIDGNFEITEELLSMESLRDTVTGKYLYNSVINTLIRSGLSLDKLASITTDGAPSLTGKHYDLVNLVNDKIKEKFPLHSVLSLHYTIFQESLWKSSLKLKHVMDPVVHAVNLIRSQGLEHRQFRNFLEDIEADFTDVLYHTNVCWLSMGKILKKVWDLKAEIVTFLNVKDISCDFSKEMENVEWVCDFAFAVDIMQKLSELNTELQSKGIFAHELHLEVKAFQLKLNLFAKQMHEQNFVHFPLLKTQAVTQTLSDKYSSQLMALKEEFNRRFAGFKAIEGHFDLLSSPFACDIETASEELQMELIDLQADNSLRRMFESKPLVEFYASLPSEKFQDLKKFARKMLVLFASTYICKQTFSIMKVNKSKNRSLLTESNLQSVLRISTSNLTPNYNKLVSTTDSTSARGETLVKNLCRNQYNHRTRKYPGSEEVQSEHRFRDDEYLKRRKIFKVTNYETELLAQSSQCKESEVYIDVAEHPGSSRKKLSTEEENNIGEKNISVNWNFSQPYEELVVFEGILKDNDACDSRVKQEVDNYIDLIKEESDSDITDVH
ncbi:general transcription factor II-I repeat domain-containing protein 2-like [Oratosquilla oratoria]|uniref:general transcription factor II-I repeat domain-containing protein 2-like n=1 Tax=Oratosquilla oratoria TaxID=337810 RepID=UPI003F76976F